MYIYNIRLKPERILSPHVFSCKSKPWSSFVPINTPKYNYKTRLHFPKILILSSYKYPECISGSQGRAGGFIFFSYAGRQISNYPSFLHARPLYAYTQPPQATHTTYKTMHIWSPRPTTRSQLLGSIATLQR